jgi:formylglycine-generating enzyme required for sulfatase activity
MRVRDLLLGIGVVASVCGSTTPTRRMVSIPAGTWRPLYGAPVKVGEFSIDRDAVTRGEYLAWLMLGAKVENPHMPMTGVTWGEARSYCVARGARLPTLAEWEYVAAASKTSRNAAADPAFIQQLVSTYATRSSTTTVDEGATNAYGVRGMHDVVWEWVGDPNARIVSIHAHGAHDLSCAGAAMGATDPRDYPAFLRSAFRSGLTESTRLPTLGFRCAA